jgi:hypothetical protein
MHIDKERRKSARIKCKSTILHNTSLPDFYYRSTMYNFSKDGLYFESNQDLLKGDQISMSIKNPPKQFNDKIDRYFDAKIMWFTELKDSSYQMGYGAKLV